MKQSERFLDSNQEKHLPEFLIAKSDGQCAVLKSCYGVKEQTVSNYNKFREPLNDEAYLQPK